MKKVPVLDQILARIAAVHAYEGIEYTLRFVNGAYQVTGPMNVTGFYGSLSGSTGMPAFESSLASVCRHFPSSSTTM